MEAPQLYDNRIGGSSTWPHDGSITLQASNGQPYSINQMVQLVSQQQIPQQQQEFLALELPTYIFVETRFITKNSSDTEEQIENTLTESMRTPMSLMSPLTSKPMKTFANAAVMAGIVRKECSTLTESENPKRNRCQQTENNSTEVGIQCCLDMEQNIDAELDAAICISDESSKLRFMEYTCENSVLHSNGRLECRVCGEIKPNIKGMESHLALHYGPRVLCFLCGIQFENKMKFREHACDAKKKRLPRLRCPLDECNLEAISRLELFDHINEHCYDGCYECKVCKRTYPTVAELQQHIKLRKKCSEAKKRIRNPYSKLRLQCSQNYVNRRRVQLIYKLNGDKALRVSRLEKCCIAKSARQCQICLMFCSNDFKFRKHRKRCMVNYYFRYKKKMRTYEQKSVVSETCYIGH